MSPPLPSLRPFFPCLLSAYSAPAAGGRKDVQGLHAKILTHGGENRHEQVFICENTNVNVVGMRALARISHMHGPWWRGEVGVCRGVRLGRPRRAGEGPESKFQLRLGGEMNGGRGSTRTWAWGFFHSQGQQAHLGTRSSEENLPLLVSHSPRRGHGPPRPKLGSAEKPGSI